MTWSYRTSLANEVAKCRWELVPYMRGACLDLGCGPAKAFPHFWGVDNYRDSELFGVQMRPDIRAEVTDLSRLASAHFDLVFSSHVLEHIEDYRAALKEWWRLVKVGGHMALYLPHRDFYPRCDKASREEWADWKESNADNYPTIEAAVEAFAQIRRDNGAKTVGEIYAGTDAANPDHEHDFVPQDIIDAMKKFGSWDLVEQEERNEDEEYSFWMVFKKL